MISEEFKDARLCSKLCDAIIHWQAMHPLREITPSASNSSSLTGQSVLPTIAYPPPSLNSSSSSRISWSGVSEILASQYQIHLEAGKCRRIWKALAYGHFYSKPDAVLHDSDTEDAYFQPIEVFERSKSTEELLSENRGTLPSKFSALKRRKREINASLKAPRSMVFVPNHVNDDNVTHIKSVTYTIQDRIPKIRLN